MAIPVLAAVLIGGSLAPAFATQKVVDIRFNDDFSFPEFVCGQVAQADVNVRGHVTIWDNDKFNIQQIIIWKFTDASGNVGHFTDTLIEHGTFGDAPQVFQQTGVITCAGTEEVNNFQFGFTLHRDGTVNFHS